jgi:dihydrodipicolinate synthase/N-acetylneuraminate lyase
MFWTTQGTSRYSYLSDREIDDLNESVAKVTKGRAIFIAGTAYRHDAARSIRFSRRAAQWGADIVMLEPEWQRRPHAERAFRFHREVAEASPLPLFTYAVKGFPDRFLKRLLELPQYVGMKNDMGDFEPHSNLLRTIRLSGRTFVPMTGGTIRPYLYGHHLGAQAFADLLLGGVAPKIVIEFSRHLDRGNYREAVRIIQDYEEPLMEAFAPLGYHACFRAMRWIKGLTKSRQDRFPEKTLDQEGVNKMRQLVEKLEL